MDSSLFELNTDRLRLIAATAETVNAEMNDPSRLSRLLRADVPKNWPPDLTEDVLASTALKLTADPANAGWYSWYMVLAKEPPEKSVVIGICSFKGRPKTPWRGRDRLFRALSASQKRLCHGSGQPPPAMGFRPGRGKESDRGNLPRSARIGPGDGEKRFSLSRSRLRGGRGSLQQVAHPG